MNFREGCVFPECLVPDDFCLHRVYIERFEGSVFPRFQALFECLDTSPQTGLLAHFRLNVFQLVPVEGSSLQGSLLKPRAHKPISTKREGEGMPNVHTLTCTAKKKSFWDIQACEHASTAVPVCTAVCRLIRDNEMVPRLSIVRVRVACMCVLTVSWVLVTCGDRTRLTGASA